MSGLPVSWRMQMALRITWHNRCYTHCGIAKHRGRKKLNRKDTYEKPTST
jgi:hypothetical protein